MNADYVENIIRNIDEKSYTYKCILVDGTWGIGKSYMVRKALEDKKDKAFYVSLFGLESAQQIYHDILYQLLLHTENGGKLVEWCKDITKIFGNFNKKIKNINTILESHFSERDLLKTIIQKFEGHCIIVVDDLERHKKGVNFEEALGIIENLKQFEQVKIILIAHSGEIRSEDKDIYDKFKEKVIDRIFEVTEHSNSIKWDRTGEQEFIANFLSQHNVKNLRTLQKARCFFNDVERCCLEIKDEKFIDEIRQICFAVVVEDTDKLYYRELPEFSEQDVSNPQKRVTRILAESENKIESRLGQYTQKLKSGEALVKCIYKYYKNEKILTKEEMEIHYKIYRKAGDIPNNYKSEKEMRQYISVWKTEFDEAKGSTELTFLAGEYDRWCQVLGEDDKELIETYEKKLEKFFVDEAKKIMPNPLDYYSGSEFDNATQTVREIYDEVLKRAKCRLVQDYIEYLCEKTNDETAWKYSGQLRDWYTDSTDIGKYIEDNLERLFTEKSFPVFGMNDCKYYTCCNIIKMLYQKDSEHFVERYKELKTSFDRMSIYRTEMILRELDILNQINK